MVKLSPEPSGPVCGFLWAPSSSKILVSTPEQVQIVSASDPSFHATIRNPASAGGKSAVVHFGARDTEVLAWSAFGLKLAVMDLSTVRVVDVSDPKFYHASSASRGFSLRPETGHLALLTCSGGKDMVSVHHPATREVQKSWCPDTIDAQGLSWTPDGRWLLLWESPAQGHRLLLFTPDGRHFRTIGTSGLPDGRAPIPEPGLQPGIKTCQPSPNAELCAISDHSRGVMVVSTQSWRESMRLLHPSTIVPRDTVQVWQEQLVSAGGKPSTHSFLRVTQMVAPPGPSLSSSSSALASPGCSLAGFDVSSTLLATRLDDAPGTLWIWDIAAGELRAVLIFHLDVSFSWHPASRELLLVTCQDEARRGSSFVWDPLSNGPASVIPDDCLPGGKAVGRPRVSWLNRGTEHPVLLVANAERYVLLYLAGAEDGSNPWQGADGDEWHGLSSACRDKTVVLDAEDVAALDDTFSFRNHRASVRQ